MSIFGLVLDGTPTFPSLRHTSALDSDLDMEAQPPRGRKKANLMKRYAWCVGACVTCSAQSEGALGGEISRVSASGGRAVRIRSST